MERFRFRSTSLVDLQAELRQRELAGEADHVRRDPIRRRRRSVFGLPVGWRGPRLPSGG